MNNAVRLLMTIGMAFAIGWLLDARGIEVAILYFLISIMGKLGVLNNE